MVRSVFLWAALTLAAAGFATAEPAGAVPDASDARFTAALDAWLDDEDAVALPAFAELARGGHADAQVLLALIERMPETHAPWLAARTRAERRALMRAPEGRSWLSDAEGDLAALWRSAWAVGTPGEVALAFAERGETRAAHLALLAREARAEGGFAALARDPRYPETLRFLAWAEAPDAAARAALAAGDPQRGRVAPEALREWLLSAAVASPVARFCRSVCPADPASCAEGAYRGLGGYRGLLSLGPPSERLILSDRWQASLKGARSIPRRIALRRATVGDTCLRRAVALTP